MREILPGGTVRIDGLNKRGVELFYERFSQRLDLELIFIKQTR